MNKHNVKVTTTPSFDGVTIEEYLEPITAHVVVGMNFFKDFFSSFTDVFGGSSKSYQKTLSSINEKVIDELREKTYLLGGNCIVGLKIDNDEISAKAKSMMMVTAIGTAARADFKNKTENNHIESVSGRLSNEELGVLKEKKHCLQLSQNDELEVNAELWDFVKQNNVFELAPYILNKYVQFVDDYSEDLGDSLNKYNDNISEYFSLLNPEIASRILYGKLIEKLSYTARSRIVKLIMRIQLIDFNKIDELLNNSNFYAKKSGIQLLNSEKQSYQYNDLPMIENLISFISNGFKERGELSKKKKALSSKEKDIWVCECKKENNMGVEYCTNCSLNIYGFNSKEVHPGDIVIKLRNDLGILKEVFKK